MSRSATGLAWTFNKNFDSIDFFNTFQYISKEQLILLPHHDLRLRQAIILFFSTIIPGGHLGKIRYGDVPLVRVPFLKCKSFWQGPNTAKSQNPSLTGSRIHENSKELSQLGSIFCHFATFHQRFWEILPFHYFI